MIKYSIFVPTYNRQNLVEKTLDSIFMQSYQNYEVLLYDNGSNPSVASTVERYNDHRLLYQRREQNINVCDLAEESLDIMSGTHFLFLADDDLLVPQALQIVTDVFLTVADIESLQVGFLYFNNNINYIYSSRNILDTFTGKLEVYDARELAYYHFSSWGLGPGNNDYKAPRMVHSSGNFIAKTLIDRTRCKQKELFIKPIGDIGYVGTLLNAEKTYYLDLPLALIGEGHPRDMDGALRGQRHRWNSGLKYLDNTPLKSASFVNMCIESQLKVLYRNGADKLFDSRIRPSFFCRHLWSVINDSPWSLITLKDFIVGIWFFFISICQFSFHLLNIKTAKLIIDKHLLSFFKVKKMQSHRSGGDIGFKNIDELLKWIQTNSVLDRYIG